MHTHSPFKKAEDQLHCSPCWQQLGHYIKESSMLFMSHLNYYCKSERKKKINCCMKMSFEPHKMIHNPVITLWCWSGDVVIWASEVLYCTHIWQLKKVFHSQKWIKPMSIDLCYTEQNVCNGNFQALSLSQFRPASCPVYQGNDWKHG